MNNTNSASQFYTAGGSLSLDATYVIRSADKQLLQAASSSEYCNVLTPRQTGKSSLMVRTAKHLQDAGGRTAIIDLTNIGTELDAEAWYLGFVTRLKEQLSLTIDVRAWWEANAQQGIVQRFSDFLRDVILKEITEPIVIFVDEIDSTLGLPFTDDFFAAIRAAYNARATDPAYKRLTFVLLGVARPADLIKDRSRTPYNIGLSIDLKDFSMEEASVLLPGLETVDSEKHAEAILRRVLYWTGGHPYLTQKVCAEIVTASDDHWTDEKIDQLTKRLFLSDEARKESNLQYVNDRIRASRDREKLLRTYRKVLSGKSIADEERNPIKSQLKLSGLLKSTPQGSLIVRNRIYKEAFNRQWIRETMPTFTATRIAVVTSTIAIIALALVGWMLYRQQNNEEILAQTYTERFLNTESPAVRITNLAGLFELGGEFADSGRNLFFSLDAGQQLAMFDLSAPEQVGEDLQTVITGIYMYLEDTDEHTALLQAMADDLGQIKDTHPDSRILCGEIKTWLQGRAFSQSGDHQGAIASYDQAIDYNDRNPATRFERALAFAATGNYQSALADLEVVISLDRNRQERVQQAIVANGELHLALWSNQETYPELIALVPTLVPTTTSNPLPAPSPMPTQPSPTPTPSLPSPVLTVLSDVAEVYNEDFDILADDRWDYTEYVEVSGDGILAISGIPEWDNWFHRKRHFEEGEGVIVLFSYTSDAEFELFLDSGSYNTSEYRRWGVYIPTYPDTTPLHINIYEWNDDSLGRDDSGNRISLEGNLTLAPDTWYYLLLAVDQEGEFLALVWDKDDPSQQAKYQRTLEKWASRAWDFAANANRDMLYIDSFTEISFSQIK